MLFPQASAPRGRLINQALVQCVPDRAPPRPARWGSLLIAAHYSRLDGDKSGYSAALLAFEAVEFLVPRLHYETVFVFVGVTAVGVWPRHLRSIGMKIVVVSSENVGNGDILKRVLAGAVIRGPSLRFIVLLGGFAV